MRCFLLCCAAVLSVLLGGCLSEHDCFQIEVKPEGEAFQRKLTCWHVGGPGGPPGDNKSIRPLGPAQVARIGSLYPKPYLWTDADSRQRELAKVPCRLTLVCDGEEATRFLHREGELARVPTSRSA
ncbi:MAG: hypothetical protein ABR915_15865 [Thermoguttaceae bacterium]|jgi:hypothetical protein